MAKKKVQEEIWFRAKTFGWGWYPYTWQAWLILLLYILTLSLTIISINNLPINMVQKTVLFPLIMFILTALLIYISWRKGEKAVWRWGN